jgi:Ca2+-binding EF-hand superfamily protein
MNKKVQVQERRKSLTTPNLEELQRLSKSEVEELKEAFKQHDKTGAGVVSRHDLIDILKGNQINQI